MAFHIFFWTHRYAVFSPHFDACDVRIDVEKSRSWMSRIQPICLMGQKNAFSGGLK